MPAHERGRNTVSSRPAGNLVPAPTPVKSAWEGKKLTFQEPPRPGRPPASNNPKSSYRPRKGQLSNAPSQVCASNAGIERQMNDLSLQTDGKRSTAPQGGNCDPSTAPRPGVPGSLFTNFPRGGLGTLLPSRFTIRYGKSCPKKWFRNPVCIKSPYKREEFRVGQVIAVPFHVSNMNEKLDPSDKGLTMTNFGPVLSKRRMFIILHIHLEGFFCLPLYSFGGRGLDAKRGDREIEYVPIMDQAHEGKFDDIISKHYPPLVHKHDNPNSSLIKSTVCHLTGGVKISWQEEITTVGRLTHQSFLDLIDYWHALVLKAQEASWN